MLLVALLLAALHAASPYPDRPGKKIVEKLCSNCHGLKLMEPMRKSRAQWQSSVDEMVTRGMKAEDDEVEAVVNYLARYLSRININQSPAADLTDVLDIQPAQSALIVEYRTKNGPFRNFDALEKVPGLDVKKLSEQRDRIAFSVPGA